MTATIDEAARHYAAGDLPATALACLDIIGSDKFHFDALYLLGVVCTNRGQHADGVSYLLRADAERPNNGRLLVNLANAFGGVQRFDKAVDIYRNAQRLGINDAGLLNNLGLALRGVERLEEAIGCFQAALILDPTHTATRFNLARAIAATGRLAEAEALFRRLQNTLPPGTPIDRIADLANEFAGTLIAMGRAGEALDVLRVAIANGHASQPIRSNEALVLMVLGRFAEGWPAYETRWVAADHDRPHPDYSIIDPDQVAGKIVLVKEEQGRGDVIQFLRYVRPLAARGARIVLSVYADLIPLAAELPEVETVLEADEVEADYDFLTSVMSLPLAFRTDITTIPAEVPYLRTPAARIGRMRHHLGPRRMPRIGVAWSGSTASYARAAMPVATLEPLLRHPGVEFHCLQNEIRPVDRAWLDQTGIVTTHEAMLRDFADTAALIEAMDLVISIDTAVAHLAGALAVPVWIMLPFNPDWRWLLNREDSPWYPTARLFRQPAPFDWNSVVRSAAAALASTGA
jgi:tetratricopeptide (TPR) repeat protein